MDVTVGERTGVLSKKRGGRRKKKGRFARKSTSFCSISPCPQKNEIFFSRNIRQFETKFLLLRLIKHNFPFIPPHCGVHIAQYRGTFPDHPAQTLFNLLNHRDFFISRPIRTGPKALFFNMGDICTTATLPFFGLYRKKGAQGAGFCSIRKGGVRLLGAT